MFDEVCGICLEEGLARASPGSTPRRRFYPAISAIGAVFAICRLRWHSLAQKKAPEIAHPYWLAISFLPIEDMSLTCRGYPVIGVFRDHQEA